MAVSGAMGSHQSHRAQTTTWLTPLHIVRALGHFDMDPCAYPGWETADRLAEHGYGTALIFARTETEGFVEQVWGKATAVRFLHGRLHFHRPDGTRAPANAGAPSVLIAYGDQDAHALASASVPGTFLRIREGAAA